MIFLRSGELKWTFDSGLGTGGEIRGLTCWSDGQDSRLFSAVASYLYALNPKMAR